MELTKFCPRCGKETDRLYGEEKKLCADCYPDKNDLLDIPDQIDITVCSVCGRMRNRGKWTESYTIEEQLLTAFEKFGEEEVHFELQYWEEDDQMYVKVHASEGEITDEYETRVNFTKEQCEDCSRFQGGFYKVKIQLRGDRDLKKVADAIADEAAEITNRNRKNFLANIDKTDHGYNFYLSTEDMNKKILSMLRNRYNPDIKRSYELIGEEEGQEVYRNVVSVRID